MSNEFAEAVQFLTRVADELSPNANARHEAGEALLRDLEHVAKESGCFVFKRDIGTRTFLVLPDSRQVQICLRNFGQVRVVAEDGKTHMDVPLWYDASSKELRSPEWDELLTPTPGEPRPHRSAVAAVVKAAVEILRTTKKDD